MYYVMLRSLTVRQVFAKQCLQRFLKPQSTLQSMQVYILHSTVLNILYNYALQTIKY